MSAERIITIIDDKGVRTTTGEHADEFLSKLELKRNESTFLSEVERKKLTKNKKE
jgi:acid phosphatase family membrane protein YuiD